MYGYSVYLINERYTSKLCASCHHEMDNFKPKEDHEKCKKCRHNNYIELKKKYGEPLKWVDAHKSD